MFEEVFQEFECINCKFFLWLHWGSLGQDGKNTPMYLGGVSLELSLGVLTFLGNPINCLPPVALACNTSSPAAQTRSTLTPPVWRRSCLVLHACHFQSCLTLQLCGMQLARCLRPSDQLKVAMPSEIFLPTQGSASIFSMYSVLAGRLLPSCHIWETWIYPCVGGYLVGGFKKTFLPCLRGCPQ